MIYKFLVKNLVEEIFLMKQIISWQMNFINLENLENLRKEKYIHHLEKIFVE